MITRLRKWGNSLGLRIPKAFAEEARIGASSEVDLSLRQGRLVVIPIRRREFTLNDLVSGITPKNRHEAVDLGEAAGRELL